MPGKGKVPKAAYLDELNPQQRAVVMGADGPCVVLAGAGSGKTRTIVYRVAYLLDQGVSPDNILLLTFTNKAADEMMRRIASLLKGRVATNSGGVWGGTFHAVANRILRVYAESLGYTSNFTILDQDDSKTLIKAVMKERGFDRKEKRFPSPAVVQQVISYTRNAMIVIEEAVELLHPKLLHHVDDFGEIAEAYDRRKKEANAMDFDDLLLKLHELLMKEEDIRERLGMRFRYILVDEYQDTNAIQAELVRLLAVGERPNVLAVGDDAQSIYSFRAADVRNILDFPKRYPDTTIFRLETNYRSVPEVLELANDVISRNAEQYPKELRSVLPPYRKPAVIPALSANREALTIAARIRQLIEEGVAPYEIAVLFRATHHSQRLEFELMRQGIEYDYRGGMRFFERAHVKDVLAFLRIIHNLADETAWRRVLGVQQGIGDVTASRIIALLRKEADTFAKAIVAPVEQACGARAGSGWKDLRGTLELMSATDGKPSSLVKSVLEGTYAEYLENEYPNAQDRMDDIRQLADFAEQYGGVQEFLTDVTLDDAAHTRAGNRHVRSADRVVLSTIHQAKGLEWEAVFVMHMNESSFPNRRAALVEGGLEEERRLFYVAATRAKRHLWLTYPSQSGFDSYGFEQPSMFLQEADPSCLDTSMLDNASSYRRRTGSTVFRSEATESFEEGYDEPAIQLNDDGEPVDAMEAVKGRMKKVRTSFLRDV